MNKQIQAALKTAFKILKAPELTLRVRTAATYNPATGRPVLSPTTEHTARALEVADKELEPGERKFLFLDAGAVSLDAEVVLPDGSVHVVTRLQPPPVGGFTTAILQGRSGHHPGRDAGKTTWGERNG